jgi:putative ABC transport system substrate-binding protein
VEGFVADKVDLIMVYPTEASHIAKDVTAGTGIPVVFVYAAIEGSDLVESVRAPGGNITGVRLPAVETALRRFDVLREIAPDARRLLVPYQTGYPIVPAQLEALRSVADAAGVTLVELSASNIAELEAALAARASDPSVDAVLLIVEPLMLAPGGFPALGAFADARGIPIGGFTFQAGSHATIFGLIADPAAAGAQAAPLADKILDGTPAGTIPVVSPESSLQINFRKAQELGLTVPDGLLSQATEIVR